MEWGQLAAFNLALLAAMLAPGPSLLVAMRTTLGEGRWSGVLVGLGLASMAALWTLMALLGLDVLLELFPWAYVALKTLGALYLIWLAVGLWRSAGAPIKAAQGRAGSAYWRGVLINVSNPKSALFAAAVLVVIFPPDLSQGWSVAIAANQMIVEALFYSTIALILSRKAVADAYLSAKTMLDRGSAAVLGALGLRLLADRAP